MELIRIQDEKGVTSAPKKRNLQKKEVNIFWKVFGLFLYLPINTLYISLTYETNNICKDINGHILYPIDM